MVSYVPMLSRVPCGFRLSFDFLFYTRLLLALCSSKGSCGFLLVIVEDAKLLFSSFVAHARLCCSCKLVVPAKGRGRAGDRLAGGRLATYNLFNLMLSKIRFNWWGSAWSPLGLCCGSLEPRCLARTPWSPCAYRPHVGSDPLYGLLHCIYYSETIVCHCG